MHGEVSSTSRPTQEIHKIEEEAAKMRKKDKRHKKGDSEEGEINWEYSDVRLR
jgi:hypothetical protein